MPTASPRREKFYHLVRTNEILPGIHFINEAQTLAGSFCQYGNLHISALTAEMAAAMEAAWPLAAFAEVPGNDCVPLFNVALSGRRGTRPV